MSWLRTPLARRSSWARRRRAFPLLPHARRTGDGMVLLPMTHGHRRHRPRRVWSRAAWIAGAILAVGFAAIALDEAGWVETLMEGSDPAVERSDAGPGPYGLGNLGLPPPDETPPPDEPPPPP